MKTELSPQLARENDEPSEASNPLPAPFLVFFAAVALTALAYLTLLQRPDVGIAGDARSVQRAPVELTGEGVYKKSCAACHQGTGLGVPGAFPPLARSPWLLDDRETPIRVVLLGLMGTIEVDGKTYAGVMPALQDQLSDREIALALSHARSSFGNDAGPIEEEHVAKVRASLAGRTAPWAGGAALEEARATKVLE